jgi:hypothetical protein
MNTKFFILDCNSNIIGNPKGYNTFRGANQQANGKSKISQQIWETFYNRTDKSDRTVCHVTSFFVDKNSKPLFPNDY